MHREDQHLRWRIETLQLRRGGRAVATGHVEIHDDDIGGGSLSDRDGIVTGCRFTDDLDVGRGAQQCAHAFAENRVVIGEEHTNEVVADGNAAAGVSALTRERHRALQRRRRCIGPTRSLDP